MNDVAEAVGLAPATVSYALRGERGSAETVRRVREAADSLGYDVDPIASALASGRSRMVAVVCGSTRDVWQQSLAGELSRTLMARGRHVLLADADGDDDHEEALLSKLRNQRPDGFVVAPLDPFATRWKELSSQVPVVSIGDRLSEAPSSGAVVFNNDRGFALVFEHLAELGHRHIGVVLPQRPSTPDRPAEELVAQWATRTGITADIVRTPPQTADPETMTHHLATTLAGRVGAQWTAAFCLNDSFAFGVLRAARRLELAVPADLSVAGFENVELADLVGPGVTSVDWGQDRVVDLAVTQLLAAIDEGDPLTTLTIEPHLMVRGSTGPAGSRLSC